MQAIEGNAVAGYLRGAGSELLENVGKKAVMHVNMNGLPHVRRPRALKHQRDAPWIEVGLKCDDRSNVPL